MLRLAIVDDHKIVRAGFREMLADELGVRVEFEAASGEEALQQLRDVHFHHAPHDSVIV